MLDSRSVELKPGDTVYYPVPSGYQRDRPGVGIGVVASFSAHKVRINLACGRLIHRYPDQVMKEVGTC